MNPRRSWPVEVPSIPHARVDLVAQEDAILLHVRHGTATVRANGRSYVAEAGQAVWIPPDLQHAVSLTPGSVALPIFVEREAVPPALRHPGVVAVPSAWNDWLVFWMSRSFGLTSAEDADHGQLLALLEALLPSAPESKPTLPPLPQSAEARAVVRQLMDDPAREATLAQVAAGVLMSPRTLQRRLSQETGLTLVQWRTAIRMTTAAGHLARGRDLGWTAHHVGYRSVGGFAHAFAAHVGTSPGRYAGALGSQSVAPAAGARPARSPAGTPEPSGTPACPPVSWVHSIDSILWVYRGEVVLTMSGRTEKLTEGDVLWVPRGVSHQLQVLEGSILLPLGWMPATHALQRHESWVMRLPDDERARRFALHLVVSNHFLLRPPSHDEHAYVELLGLPSPGALPEWSRSLAAIVSNVLDDPSDSRSLRDWAGSLGVDPAGLRRAFVVAVGESFPSWRATVRMSRARLMMWEGHELSVVARRLGYAHLSGFSRAFTAAHQMPPREWLHRVA